MAKTIMILDENSCSSGKTYSRRAKQLVIKGQAKWIDETTIQINALTTSQEMEDKKTMTHTVDEMVDEVVENNIQAVDSIDIQQRSFKIGDVVTLNSGGVLMTVMEPPKEGTVYCQWWANSGFSAQSFPIQTLKLQER